MGAGRARPAHAQCGARAPGSPAPGAGHGREEKPGAAARPLPRARAPEAEVRHRGGRPTAAAPGGRALRQGSSGDRGGLGPGRRRRRGTQTEPRAGERRLQPPPSASRLGSGPGVSGRTWGPGVTGRGQRGDLRDDGGRNQNSSQGVDSAIPGSDLDFFHRHIVCQNLSLERSNGIFLSVLQGHQWSPGRSEQWRRH